MLRKLEDKKEWQKDILPSIEETSEPIVKLNGKEVAEKVAEIVEKAVEEKPKKKPRKTVKIEKM